MSANLISVRTSNPMPHIAESWMCTRWRRRARGQVPRSTKSNTATACANGCGVTPAGPTALVCR